MQASDRTGRTATVVIRTAAATSRSLNRVMRSPFRDTEARGAPIKERCLRREDWLRYDGRPATPQPLRPINPDQQERSQQDDRRPRGEVIIEGEDQAPEGDPDADPDRPQEHAPQVLPEHQAD